VLKRCDRTTCSLPEQRTRTLPTLWKNNVRKETARCRSYSFRFKVRQR